MPKGSVHQSCTNTGQLGDPSDDYKPRAALEGTHFFRRKLTCPPKMNYFGLYCNSPNGYAHSNCTAILCRGVWPMPKVTLRLSKSCVQGHSECLS